MRNVQKVHCAATAGNKEYQTIEVYVDVVIPKIDTLSLGEELQKLVEDILNAIKKEDR